MPEKETKYRAEVGARLRAAREALELDQGEIGSIFGVGANAVSQYEKGRRLLAPELAAKLQRQKGITLDYLFAGDPRGLSRDLYDKIMRPKAVPAIGVRPEKRRKAGRG